MSDYRCDACARRLTAPGLLWRCPCGGPLSIAARGRFDPRSLPARPFTLWRYREAIALGQNVEPITLGEGFTPIVQKEIDGWPFLFKLEFLMPTGSFKDRGATVVMSQMAASGVARAIEDSSGNAGAAMAAYGSRAGIEVEILVPDDAPRGKLAAIEACGGRLGRIPGGRAAVSAEALRRAGSGIPFASHVWNPYFTEGTKTFAFEIWEQRERRIPPRIFLPVGNGSLLAGAADGFGQLREEGLCDSVSRLIGVQAALCAPLVQPDGAPPAPAPGTTLADGIRIASPPRARRIREAARRSGGGFAAVGEVEILEALTRLGQAGLDVEPTAAVGFAGALAWARANPEEAAREIEAAGPALVALTGSGLKARP